MQSVDLDFVPADPGSLCMCTGDKDIFSRDMFKSLVSRAELAWKIFRVQMRFLNGQFA